MSHYYHRRELDLNPYRPNTDAERVAAEYLRWAGMPALQDTEYVKVNPDVAREIARIFEETPDQSGDAQVQLAYRALVQEVEAQYQLVSQAVQIGRFGEGDGNPYADSPAMMEDIFQNRRLLVFDGGADHALMTREQNFRFRAVHDFFGHAMKGFAFGPRGEENAWIEHCKLFSPLARWALTTETRAQNSWVNFGPYAGLAPVDRPYAEQKVFLLPLELCTVLVFEQAYAGVPAFLMRSLAGMVEAGEGGLEVAANPVQINWIQAAFQRSWETLIRRIQAEPGLGPDMIPLSAIQERPGYLPGLGPLEGKLGAQHGCGEYGCVFAVDRPGWVCKLTSDESEARFVAVLSGLASRSWVAPAGLVRYMPQVWQIDAPGAPRWQLGRKLWIFWREEVHEAGVAGSRITGVDSVNYLMGLYNEGLASLNDLETSLGYAREWSTEWRDNGYRIMEAIREHKNNSRWLDAQWDRYYHGNVNQDRDTLAHYLDVAFSISEKWADVQFFEGVGSALQVLLGSRLVPQDIHMGNLGLVRRPGEDPFIAIFDPGHVSFLTAEYSKYRPEKL